MHFVQSEAPLLIGPLMPDMTSSELHAVMTGGFATITGGIMAAYILLGVIRSRFPYTLRDVVRRNVGGFKISGA